MIEITDKIRQILTKNHTKKQAIFNYHFLISLIKINLLFLYTSYH